MTDVQIGARPILRTKVVYFKGSEKPPVGGVVCYDPTAPKVPAAGTFDEDVLGVRVVKPATANLRFFAGIVKNDEDYQSFGKSNENRFLKIIVPTDREFFQAWTKANMTLGTSLLGPANDQWELAITVDVGIAIAKAAETVDTSVTAAIKAIQFLS